MQLDMKIKRNVRLLFSPPLSLIFPFLLFSLSLYFFIAWSNFKAFRSRENKVHMSDLIQSVDTVFIHSVISMFSIKFAGPQSAKLEITSNPWRNKISSNSTRKT